MDQFKLKIYLWQFWLQKFVVLKVENILNKIERIESVEGRLQLKKNIDK